LSLTCFEHPSVQFYGVSFMHPYKQSGRWQDVHLQVFLRMNTWMFKTSQRHYN